MNAIKAVLVSIGCIGVMIGASGCANKEVVKKEEPVVKESTAKPVSAVAADSKTKATPTPKKEESKKPAATAIPSASGSTALQQPANIQKLGAALENIYFDFDRSDLSSSARDTLSHDAEVILKEMKEANIRIEGNCDERGSAEYNLALGERRAKEAAKYLKALGVQPMRLSVVSYGKEKPAVQGNNEAAWAKNRRDEFVIVK